VHELPEDRWSALVQSGLSVSRYAWWLWAVVGVGLLLAWLGLARRLLRAIPRSRRSRSVARFAAEHGWRYTRRDWLDVGPGAPFAPGETTPCTNIVVGEVGSQPFTAFEYAHEVQAFVIDLAGDLPFLEVRPRTMVDEATPQRTPVDLESEEFNRRFRVIADDARYATAVLSPQLMTRLLPGPELSWRILGRKLVGWQRGTLDVALIEPAVATLHTIKEAIPSFVWDDFATPSDT
jgi:hypothetical protein